MKKVNPRRRPANGADVDRAWEKGVRDGIRQANAIFLTVFADKFGGGDQIPKMWEHICKLSEEIGEGRVSVSDLRRVLLEEYGVDA